MIDSNQFIINKIKELVGMFSQINVRYSYEQSSQFHIIEVASEDIRRGNQDYMNKEFEIIMEFDAKFPEEDLLISEFSEINHSTTTIFQTENTVIYTSFVPYKFKQKTEAMTCSNKLLLAA